MRLIASLLVLASTAVLAQQPAWQADQRGISIPMRDGQSLSADLYLPPKPGRYPTVLIQTPYKKERMFARMFKAGGESGTPQGKALGDAQRQAWVDRQRYAYLVVDWRGFYGSRAAKKARYPRGRDGYDSVEWIAKQPWSNGKVGTWGGSALGKIQFDTAVERPPHLVCAVPMIAAIGQDYRQNYRGGVLSEWHVKRLDQLGFGMGAMIKSKRDPKAPLWTWAKRLTYKPQRFEVPMLLITGWWDHYPSLILESFRDICAKAGPRTRQHSKLLIGPWDHMSTGLETQGDLRFAAAVGAHDAAVKRFFARWLLEQKDNGWDAEPRYRWYQIGAKAWRQGEALPKPLQTAWLLGREGRITRDEAVAGARQLVHDPAQPTPTLGGANLDRNRGPRKQNPLHRRQDVLTYTTPAMTRPLTLIGEISASLVVSASADADLHARLAWVHPDGDSYLLSDTAQRLSMARGFAPGAKLRVTLRFPATALTLAPGYRLELLVSASNAPRYEVRQQAATMTVHHGAGENASRLILPTHPQEGQLRALEKALE